MSKKKSVKQKEKSKKSGNKKYNTNLAAEFYVLSMLYRKGFKAHLTLGNRKSVDIVIENSKGGLLTVDVKGLVKKANWPMDNFRHRSKTHFLVLVSFHNKIGDCKSVPECWVVPSKKIEGRMVYRNPAGNRRVIKYSYMRDHGKSFYQNWDLLQ